LLLNLVKPFDDFTLDLVMTHRLSDYAQAFFMPIFHSNELN